MTVSSPNWRLIPGTTGKYEAYRFGLIRRVGQSQSLNHLSRSGAPGVALTLHGFQHQYKVIVLIGLAWVGRPNDEEHFELINTADPLYVVADNIRIAPFTGNPPGSRRGRPAKMPSPDYVPTTGPFLPPTGSRS